MLVILDGIRLVLYLGVFEIRPGLNDHQGDKGPPIVSDRRQFTPMMD